MSRIWCFGWGLVYVFVAAENREGALALIRAPNSTARQDYPNYDFDEDPNEEDAGDHMITHFGCD